MLIYNIVLHFLKNGEKTNISEINGEKYSKIAIYFLVVYLAFFQYYNMITLILQREN